MKAKQTRLPRSYTGKILLTPRTGLAICRVNLVLRRVYRSVFLKSLASRPSWRDSVIAARSQIRLRESNFGEWQVGVCEQENSGWRYRETRPRGARRSHSGNPQRSCLWNGISYLLRSTSPRGANYSPPDAKSDCSRKVDR